MAAAAEPRRRSAPGRRSVPEFFSQPSPFQGEEPQGQQAQGHVMVPPHIGADLVVSQPAFVSGTAKWIRSGTAKRIMLGGAEGFPFGTTYWHLGGTQKWGQALESRRLFGEINP